MTRVVCMVSSSGIDSFVSRSGYENLQIDYCHWLLIAVEWLCFLVECRWDEEKFGFEYDLDLFNIVAVDDFNMGALMLLLPCLSLFPTDTGLWHTSRPVWHRYVKVQMCTLFSSSAIQTAKPFRNAHHSLTVRVRVYLMTWGV